MLNPPLVKSVIRYDLVLASEVIEHVQQPDQFVKMLAQLLKQAPSEAKERGDGEGGGRQGSGENSGGCSTSASKSEAQAGGLLILSTMNRTAESFAVAIVGAEYVARVVPQGTHEWHRFITPEEIALMAAQVRPAVDPTDL